MLRYNGTTGAFLNTFVPFGSGGLFDPSGLTFGPDGNLYVSEAMGTDVLRYNGTTGAFIGAFASGSGLSGSFGLTFGPDGNLYVVSSFTNSVLRYNGVTGAFIDAFVPSGSGGLFDPLFLAFSSRIPVSEPPTFVQMGIALLSAGAGRRWTRSAGLRDTSA